MKQEDGCQWYHSIGRFKLFSRKFSNKFGWPHPVSETYEKIWETCMPRGEFKHRYWFFTDAPNIGRNVSVI
jgi:hypothetical protein